MSLDLTIGGASIEYVPSSFQFSQDITMTWQLSFTVINAGSTHYTNRMLVTATDSVKGLIFAGYIDEPDEQNLYPNANNQISITCIDYRYILLKLRPEYDYNGMQAGDIIVDLIDVYLTAEGVLANYAYRSDRTQAGFAAGTLSGTTATSNNGGDLELSLAGSALTTVTDTTSGWNAGTLTSVVGSNNTLVLKSRTGICLAADCNGNQGNSCDLHWNIWTGSYTIQSGDSLVYKVWINGSSPEIKAAMDFTCTDGTTLETFPGPTFLHDQNGIDGMPSVDLRGFADNQHYFRSIDLTPFAGKVIATFSIAFGGSSGGHYVAYFFDNTIMNSGSTSLTIYANNGSLNANFQGRDIGYSNVSVTTPTVYDTPGTRISGATSLTSVGIASAGIAAISETVPTGSTLEIDTSFDGGATWQPASDRQAISGLISGASLSGISLTTRQVLTITGDDPIVTPVVSSLAANFTPSYSATKHDVFEHADDSTSWNSLGSDQGGCNIGTQLTIKGTRRNWDDASIASQTLYGSSTPTQGTNYRRFYTATNSTGEVHSRFDFAGNTWQDFQLDIDVQVPSDNTQSVGMIYRTSNWNNGNNTYGWVVDVTTTQIELGYGSDSGSSGTYHNKATFNPAGFALAAGSVHTLTVNPVGANHKIYLDGVKVIDITDSTFNQAGYVATHAFNSSGANVSYFFDNFGISDFLSGDYETNSISLNTLATVGDSFIAWQNETLPAGCTLLVQVTLDGGSTFATCTNGAEIPGLTPGTSTSGVSIQIFVSMISGSTAYTPTVDGLMFWVTSAFSSSGTRKSPVLNLGNWRAGGSSLTWDDILPSGCTLGMDISPDGSTWTDVTADNGDPVPSSFFFAQPDPYIDYFSSDTSANYTSTDYGSGATGTWTFDTANNRLVGSGGTRAALQYNSTNRQDEYAEADFNWSEGGGLFVRMTDSTHLYYIQVNDASSASNPNTLKLFKFVTSTATQLGTTQTIAFTRGDYVHIKLDAQGSALTVYFNGQQILSVTDTAITGNGKCGFLCGTKIQALSLRVLPYGDNVNGQTLYTRQRLASTNPQATPQVTNVTLSVRDPEIGTGAFIANTNYAYQDTIDQAWSDLASQSTTPNPYLAYIDQNLEAHFKAQSATPAPFYLFAGANPATSTFLANPRPVVAGPDMNYCNRITVDGGTDSVSLPPVAVHGDGFTQTWTMPMPLFSEPSVLLNGAIQQIGVQGVDSGKDFYWQQGSAEVSQDPSEIPPGPSDAVIFAGLEGQINVRVTLNNTNGTGIYAGTIGQSQLALIDNTSGIVHDYLNVPGLNTAAATALAESQLIQRGRLGKNLTGSTKKWGLQPGMLAGCTIPQQNAINVPFLITKTTLTLQVTQDTDPDVIDGILYTWAIEGTTGPTIGNWTRLFSKLLAVNASSMR